MIERTSSGIDVAIGNMVIPSVRSRAARLLVDDRVEEALILRAEPVGRASLGKVARETFAPELEIVVDRVLDIHHVAALDSDLLAAPWLLAGPVVPLFGRAAWW